MVNEMKFEIVLTRRMDIILNLLMRKNKTLVEGKEMTAWLCGEWDNTESNFRLLIDDILIPSQVVSGAEVDTDHKSMTELIKEYGIDKTNRIKAHWHIHPFGDCKTSFSGGDVTMMTEHMEDRELFVFLVSSNAVITSRLYLKTQFNLLGFKMTELKQIDDVEIVVEEDAMTTTIEKEIEQIIKDKVSIKKPVLENTSWKGFNRGFAGDYGGWYDYGWGGYSKKKKDIEPIESYEQSYYVYPDEKNIIYEIVEKHKKAIDISSFGKILKAEMKDGYLVVTLLPYKDINKVCDILNAKLEKYFKEVTKNESVIIHK